MISLDEYKKKEELKIEKRQYDFERRVEEYEERNAINLTNKMFEDMCECNNTITAGGDVCRINALLHKEFKDLSNNDKCFLMATTHPIVEYKIKNPVRCGQTKYEPKEVIKYDRENNSNPQEQHDFNFI